jgi:hypothetical protein
LTYWIGFLDNPDYTVLPRGCYKEKLIASYRERERVLGIRLPGVCKADDLQYFRVLCALRKMCFMEIHLPSSMDTIKAALHAGWDMSQMIIELDSDDIFTAQSVDIVNGSEIWTFSSLKCGFAYLGPRLGFICFDRDKLKLPSDFKDAAVAEEYYRTMGEMITKVRTLEDSEPPCGFSREAAESLANQVIQEYAKEYPLFQGLRVWSCIPTLEELCRCIKEHLAPDFFHYIYNINTAVNGEILDPKWNPYVNEPCARKKPLLPSAPSAFMIDEPQNKSLTEDYCHDGESVMHSMLQCFYEALREARENNTAVLRNKDSGTRFIIGNYDTTWHSPFGDIGSRHSRNWASHSDYIYNTSYDNLPDEWGYLTDYPETRGKTEGSWIDMFKNFIDLDSRIEVALFKCSIGYGATDLDCRMFTEDKEKLHELLNWANQNGWTRIWVFPGSEKFWNCLTKVCGLSDREACQYYLDLCKRLCEAAKEAGWPREAGRYVERYTYLYCKYYPHCEECDHNDPTDWTSEKPPGYPPVGQETDNING